MEFAGLLGNEELKKRLSVSFGKGKHPHCCMICGPEGSGKKTLARQIAKALQCRSQAAPCETCNVCRKVENGIHPDVIIVDDPEKKTVGVELIRNLQSDAFVHPNEGAFKIYVIPRAHLMTDSAQNALLKLIEEPPFYAVFLLLTTGAEKLLSTVRSRSVELRMQPVPWNEAAVWLKQQCPGSEEQTLQAAHLRCGGFLGQTVAYVRAEDELPQTKRFVQVFAGGDRFELAALTASMEKMPRDQVLACFGQWKQSLTDALMVRSGLPGPSVIVQLGRQRTAQDLAQAAQTVQTAMELCAANVGIGHICGWLAVSL